MRGRSHREQVDRDWSWYFTRIFAFAERRASLLIAVCSIEFIAGWLHSSLWNWLTWLVPRVAFCSPTVRARLGKKKKKKEKHQTRFFFYRLIDNSLAGLRESWYTSRATYRLFLPATLAVVLTSTIVAKNRSLFQVSSFIHSDLFFKCLFFLLSHAYVYVARIYRVNW